MAKVKIQGNASGTGVITLIAPNTNTDRTITLPDESITLAGGVDGIVSTATGTAITIDSSERVGFGTSSPDREITVYAANARIGIKSSDTASGASQIHFGDTDNSQVGKIQYEHSDNSMRFDTNATQQFKITSDGRGLSSFTAKAWAKFTGMSTPSFRAQHNMSSITDNGTGNYRLYYTNALGDSDYAVTTAGCAEAVWGEQPCVGGETSTYVDIHNVDEGGTNYDSSRLFFTVFSG
jgi:hypothetical protein